MSRLQNAVSEEAGGARRRDKYDAEDESGGRGHIAPARDAVEVELIASCTSEANSGGFM